MRQYEWCVGNEIIIGLAMSLIFAFLPFAFPTMPKWIAWSGIAGGLTMFIAALAPDAAYLRLFPSAPPLALQLAAPLATAALVGGTLWTKERRALRKEAPPTPNATEPKRAQSESGEQSSPLPPKLGAARRGRRTVNPDLAAAFAGWTTRTAYIDIRVMEPGAEAKRFARELENALRMNGWQVSGVDNVYLGDTAQGVLVCVRDQRSAHPMARIIVDALNAQGIEATVKSTGIQEWPDTHICICIGSIDET